MLCSVSRQLVQWGADPITSPITSMNVRSTGARSEGEGGHGQMRSCDARDRSLVNSRIAASSPRVTIASLKNLPSSRFAAREAGKTRHEGGVGRAVRVGVAPWLVPGLGAAT